MAYKVVIVSYLPLVLQNNLLNISLGKEIIIEGPQVQACEVDCQLFHHPVLFK